jgi:hypothetical protein
MIPLQDESRRPTRFAAVTASASAQPRVVASGSETLQRLHDQAPPGEVTLRWVLDRLQTQAFGLLLVLLAVAAAAPGICTIAGVLIIVVAAQIVVGRQSMYFPAWLANYPLRRRYLDSIVTHAIPVLGFLERGVCPRWPRMVAATRPLLGIVLVILSVQLVLIPLPLSNIPIALLILLISLAYLEEDGLALTLALAAGVGLLGANATLIGEFLGHHF